MGPPLSRGVLPQPAPVYSFTGPMNQTRPPPRGPAPAKTRLAERLVADGVISSEQQEAAVSYVQRTGERIEEALLEVDAVDEVTLLKYLAGLYKTRFVSTEKLSKADIDRITLDKVPKKLA